MTMKTDFETFLEEYKEMKRTKDSNSEFPSTYRETKLALGMMIWAKELKELNLL